MWATGCICYCTKPGPSENPNVGSGAKAFRADTAKRLGSSQADSQLRSRYSACTLGAAQVRVFHVFSCEQLFVLFLACVVRSFGWNAGCFQGDTVTCTAITNKNGQPRLKQHCVEKEVILAALTFWKGFLREADWATEGRRQGKGQQKGDNMLPSAAYCSKPRQAIDLKSAKGHVVPVSWQQKIASFFALL